jgi:hypothetical protein
MKILPDEEMDLVIAKFANYGPRDKEGGGKTDGRGHVSSDVSSRQSDATNSNGSNSSQQQNQAGDSTQAIKLPTSGSDN